jgi:hypothetical protein
LQFGEELKHFAESLERLNDVFNNVEQQREIRAWLPYDRSRLQTALRPLPDITGDFTKTLRACDKLLSDHSKFRRNAAGFVDNVRWWMGVEAEVDKLKERVRFHSTKILLITKPVELQLLLDLRQDIFEVRNIVEDIRGLIAPVPTSPQVGAPDTLPSQFRLPLVPPELEARFLTAFSKRQPPIDIAEFPLREGFDALVHHFSQSTVDFVPKKYSEQRTPELTQYLNLIKSTWILEKITESCFFVQNSLWAKCVENIGNDLLFEYDRFHRGQIINPGDDVILRLEDHAFAIWLEEETIVVEPTLTDERPGEEKLLEIALPKTQPNRSPVLVIFRKSDTDFRLVNTTKDESNELFFEAESHEMNITLTRFIPIYAVPNSVSSTDTNNILLCSNQGQSEKAFSFATLNDVHAFQHAMTGYKVVADLSNINWSSFKESESGKCRIQVWRAKTLARITAGNTSPSPSPPMGIRRESTAKTSLSARSLAATIATTAQGSVIHGKHGPAVMFPKPEPPVIVMFTLCKDIWTYLHFEVDKNVFINPKGCNCNDCRKGSAKTCRRVVIESSGKLKIKRTSADERAGMTMWDLALLRRPAHPNSGKGLTMLPVKYIVFAFSSLSGESFPLVVLGGWKANFGNR